MHLSKYDLCESCREVKLRTGETIGEVIEICNIDGTFKDETRSRLTCMVLFAQLNSYGGCSRCVAKMKEIAKIP